MQQAKLEAGNTACDYKGQARAIRRSGEWAALFKALVGMLGLARFGLLEPWRAFWLARAFRSIKLDIHSLHTTGMLRDFKEYRNRGMDSCCSQCCLAAGTLQSSF